MSKGGAIGGGQTIVYDNIAVLPKSIYKQGNSIIFKTNKPVTVCKFPATMLGDISY